MTGYTIVEPTTAELAKRPASRPNRATCDTCGKRIWHNVRAMTSHERAKAHRAPTGAAALTGIQEAELRYFADPTPQNNAQRGARTPQTLRKLEDLNLICRASAWPYTKATDAGHDWIEAKDGAAARQVARMVRDGLTSQADAVSFVRQALAMLATSGAKPATAAAMMRALDARYPVTVTPIDATPAETFALLHDAVRANPWGECGPCDGTDAPMARKAHPCGLTPQPF